MGSLIDRRVTQTRAYYNYEQVENKNNYDETFPITVFDAVRMDINDENSMTLTEILAHFENLINNKQPIIPAKSANYLMTYGGSAGAVGSIQISSSIPWDSTLQSNERIPTEKAVGQLLYTLGILDEDGNPTESDDFVSWTDIIGRPNAYHELGNNTDGFVVQSVVSEALAAIRKEVGKFSTAYETTLEKITIDIDTHKADLNNPHEVTIDQIGAASKQAFDDHINDHDNPHNVTAAHLGLNEVDNTSDIDKPVSSAVQKLIDSINSDLSQNTEDLSNLVYFVSGEYVLATGKLILTTNTGELHYINIPIAGLLDEIKYDKENKILVYTEAGGYSNSIDISELYIRYLGSVGDHITLSIDGTQATGDQTINASINYRSITEEEIATDAIISRVIANSAITTLKIDNEAVTTSKIANSAVDDSKIAENAVRTDHLYRRSVTAAKLFTSDIANTVLTVGLTNSDPVWSKITTLFIEDDAITTNLLLDRSVTSIKIAESAILSEHLSEDSILSKHIKDGEVTNDKISKYELSGDRLESSTELPGTPTIQTSPSSTSNGREIVTTEWLRDRLANYEIDSSQIAARAIDGSKLFTTSEVPRALVVTSKNNDAYWGFISHAMIDDDAIDTSQLIDRAVTSEKIAKEVILNEHLGYRIISNDQMQDNSVALRNFETFSKANYVLGTIQDNTTPEYTKVLSDMIMTGAIKGHHLDTGAITIDKIQSSEIGYEVLSVMDPNSEPVWDKVVNAMLADRIIDGRTFATSMYSHKFWAVTVAGEDPSWSSLTSEMLADGIVKSNHIADGQILVNHFSTNIIDTEHLVDKSVTSEKLADGCIGTDQLFTSPYPNRVLAVGTKQYGPAEWLQVSTAMIEDEAITREKLFTSKSAYRVLGATEDNGTPEYLMITSDFITDRSILPNDLAFDFVLYGTPEITVRPEQYARNHQVPDTEWVWTHVEEFGFNPDNLDDHCIPNRLLETSDQAPRVLGINKPNAIVEYIQIERGHIKDGEVTTEKLQHDIELGTPTLEVRPPADACDNNGNGNLIPDCQWICDMIDLKIKEAFPDFYYALASANAKPAKLSWEGGKSVIELQFSNTSFLPLEGFPVSTPSSTKTTSSSTYNTIVSQETPASASNGAVWMRFV